ncbi:cytochrome P450 [Zopfochytrium polystomum]|nr:cytochrome P450 [Zopfochytrium polystomum]
MSLVPPPDHWLPRMLATLRASSLPHLLRRSASSSTAAAAVATAVATAAAVAAVVQLVRMHLRTRHSPIKGVPCPPEHFLLGHLPLYSRTLAKRYDMQLDMFRVLGPNWAMNIPNAFGVRAFLFTADPAVIEHILKDKFEDYVKGERTNLPMRPWLGDGIFTANGEAWRRSRKVSSNIFTLKNFRETINESLVEHITIFLDHLEAAANGGQVIDLSLTLKAYATDSFTRFAFNDDLDCLRNLRPLPPFVAAFDELFLLIGQSVNDMFYRYTRHLPTRRNRRVAQQIKVTHDYSLRKIWERRRAQREAGTGEAGRKVKDLLDFFMDYRDAEGKALTGQGADGYDFDHVCGCTSVTLSWAFYLLASHPRVVEKIREETKRVTGGAYPTFDRSKDMKYTTAVFHETLRLYPIVPNGTKYSTKRDVLPGNISIEPNTLVTFSGYAMGRLEWLWGADAGVFRPERWLDTAETGAVLLRRESAFRWPAFHAGPRACLGQTMATFQAVLVLSTVLERFEVELVAPGEVEYVPTITMQMKRP